MALAKYGAIITDMKGKLGGHHFKSSLSGATVSTNRQPEAVNDIRYNPRQPEAVNDIRFNFQRAASAWQALTVLEQKAWQASAVNFPFKNKYGALIKPSGYHCFVGINARLLNTGGSIITTPPAPTSAPAVLSFTITSCSSSALVITLGSAVPTGYVAQIKCTRSLSAGRQVASKNFSLVQQSPAATTGAVNIWAGYRDLFGNPITGNTLWIVVVLINTSNGAAYNSSAQFEVIS